ncbi:MAG TPA: tetratricopeptide repeat protein [Vicinamibacterales bacterium]|jgi:TolA-binding protein|nr:tetratricopeptide repeat protein [Vicinamibacterales bacterium]
MKGIERHKLKENDFARTVAHARDALETRRSEFGVIALVAALVVAAALGYYWWRSSRNAAADTMLANAVAIYDAPVVPVAPPAPGSPPPVPQPGTYPTEQAKLQAALPKFTEAADAYPSTAQGIAARYHAAGILAGLGRFAEAEQRYQEVASKAGQNSIYGRTARLGLADALVAQGKYDNAINVYTELSRDTNSQIPVDGVLIQLGRAYARAGRKDEAVRAFNRIVSEFPQSLYVADARRELEEVRKS